MIKFWSSKNIKKFIVLNNFKELLFDYLIKVKSKVKKASKFKYFFIN